MSDPIRCFSTNRDIGAYRVLFDAIKDHLNKNPPKEGEPTLLDYMKEFGINQYPQIMRMTNYVEFKDAHLLNK